MANPYCNLPGNENISDTYQMITEGFDGVDTDLQGHIGKGGNAHAVATPTKAGFQSAEDFIKLDGIEAGAEVNQPAFSKINGIQADDPEDELTFEEGTGIAITTDPASKKVRFTATGDATPGPHATSHIPGGNDVIPDAVAGGSSGLMSGADNARSNNLD
ncbi:hypothetical protein [Cohnella sp. AR92]|uniref:hypothetical protein n=1 Tax=Cohnella sp. AR92 TaxID=648716 RepID=UPI000F8E851A|nr:hypothetical protein [Cohnella sp. AR92]RUS41844.1 hypothetical protein ELR57_27740 [Cohnella sp. AR92]